MKICPYCENRFNSDDPRKVYCCRKHMQCGTHKIKRGKSPKAVIIRTLVCPHCKIEFQTTNSRQIYCSIKHKNYALHKKSGYKACKEYIMKSPRNYLADLRGFHKRRETLSLDFLVDLYEKQQGLCALTKTPMTYIRGQGKIPTNMSIDRIDSTKGYEPDNIRLICGRVNVMKLDGTDDELKDWCRKILSV